jgi:ABC-2 type transport system permease protein
MRSREPLRALLAHNLLLARRDLAPLIVFIAMPLVLMAFLQPALRLSLHAEGYTGATGAEQAVPGMAVMFVLFMIGVVGFRIFEEHGWGTWDRLRASPAGRTAIIVGKVAPSFLVLVAQLVVLFVAGALIYDLAITGSLLALALVALAFAMTVLTLGVLLAAVLSTVQQLNAAANIGATALAGLGGALVPIGVLPGWSQAIAPATPSHWAMEGFRTVILDAGGIADVAVPVLVLSAFAAGFTLLGASRFRVDDVKVAFA